MGSDVVADAVTVANAVAPSVAALELLFLSQRHREIRQGAGWDVTRVEDSR